LIKHMYVVEKMDRERIQEMSGLISDPRNLNIYLRSKSFEKTPEACPIEDPWYKTKYGKEKFSEKLLGLMVSPKVAQHKNKQLDLPPPNNLLPKNLDVLPTLSKEDDEVSKKPVLIKQWADDTDLWYMKDDKYLRPKGIVSLKIYTGDCEFGRTP